MTTIHRAPASEKAAPTKVRPEDAPSARAGRPTTRPPAGGKEPPPRPPGGTRQVTTAPLDDRDGQDPVELFAALHRALQVGDFDTARRSRSRLRGHGYSVVLTASWGAGKGGNR